MCTDMWSRIFLLEQCYKTGRENREKLASTRARVNQDLERRENRYADQIWSLKSRRECSPPSIPQSPPRIFLAPVFRFPFVSSG